MGKLSTKKPNDESQARISAFFQIGNSPAPSKPASKLFSHHSHDGEKQTFKAKTKLSLHTKKPTGSSRSADRIPDTSKEKGKSNKTFYGAKPKSAEQLLLSPTRSPRAGPSLVHIKNHLMSPEKGLSSPTFIPETPEKCSETNEKPRSKKTAQRRSFLTSSSSVVFKAGNVYQPGMNRSKSMTTKGPSRSLEEALTDDTVPTESEQMIGKAAISTVLTDMGLGAKEQKLMGLNSSLEQQKHASSKESRLVGLSKERSKSVSSAIGFSKERSKSVSSSKVVRRDSRKRTLSKEESPHPKRRSNRLTPKKEKGKVFSSRAAAMIHNSRAALELSRLSSMDDDEDDGPLSDHENDDSVKENFSWGIKRSSLSGKSPINVDTNSMEAFNWGVKDKVSPTGDKKDDQGQPPEAATKEDSNFKWGAAKRFSLSSDNLMDTDKSKLKKTTPALSRARKSIFARNLSCDKIEAPLDDILSELKTTNSSTKSVTKPSKQPKPSIVSKPSITPDDKPVAMDTLPVDGEDEALDDIMKELKEKILSPEAVNKLRSSRPVISPYTSLQRKKPRGVSRQLIQALGTSPPDSKPDELNKSLDAEPKESTVAMDTEATTDVDPEPKTPNTSMDLGSDVLAALDVTMVTEMDKVSMSLSQLMSPIKHSVAKSHTKAPLVPEDPPPAAQFGRHKVNSVEHQGHDVVLHVTSDPGGQSRRVILEGFWSDVRVSEGDIINVLGEFSPDSGECRVTDAHNLLVVHPDLLISGTAIVASVHCTRRSVLNEKYKGMENGNIYMLYGSLIHSLFQKVLQERAFSKLAIEKIASEILKDSSFLHQMYSQEVSEAAVREEIDKYVPQILSFVEKYVPPKHYSLGQKINTDVDTTITDIVDIEENVWSPRYGIKGKIDLSVQVKLHDRQKSTRQTKVVPLELKTGRSTFSIEHKGQVTLYSMMFGDRREDPGLGLLLYLKDGKMEKIPADHSNKRGLLQLRNELASYLHTSTDKVADPDSRDGWSFGRLPAPINRQNMCAKCPQRLNCVLTQRTVETWSPPPGHVMEALAPESLAHLRAPHLTYFSHWTKLLQLEVREARRKGATSALWCQTGWQREQKGECLSSMLLVTDGQQTQTDGNNTLLVFRRKPQHPNSVAVSDVGLNRNDSVVVSAENRPLIALCQGFVRDLTTESVTVTLDRDLREYPEYRDLVYRLDKNDSFSVMGTNFTNLARLMEDSPHSAKLREVLIERKPPRFEPKLSKSSVEQVKDIFKSLNKPQKTAILKVLMSQDYVLIKGYPGTGKTSTIVSLVRMFMALGKSVLLASYTHSAVDNILLKLKQHTVDFVRLGRPQKIHPEILPHSGEVLSQGVGSVAELAELYANKPVVATTCLGTNHALFSRRTFDVCIVDEASQVLQPTCFGTLLCSDKFVLVGDPLQLPPVVQSNEARAGGLDESLFARLDDTGGTYELNMQYRMNSSIMRLSNELVYDGALRCGTAAIGSAALRLKNTTPLQGDVSPWLQQALDTSPGQEVIWLDTRKLTCDNLADGCQGPKVKNTTEAKIVLDLVTMATNCGLPQDSVGVITPFRQQVWLLRDQLRRHGDLGAVEVNTVDQYQGRDKEMIVMSFVKHSVANAQPENKGGGILNDLRRLNVAITRAKHKLILIGCVPALLSYQPVAELLSLINAKHIIELPPT